MTYFNHLQACIDVGFFYVVNHGIDASVVREMFTQSQAFFSLPLEEKMKSLHNVNYRGYTPYLDEKLDAANQVKGSCRYVSYIKKKVRHAMKYRMVITFTFGQGT